MELLLKCTGSICIPGSNVLLLLHWHFINILNLQIYIAYFGESYISFIFYIVWIALFLFGIEDFSF